MVPKRLCAVAAAVVLLAQTASALEFPALRGIYVAAVPEEGTLLLGSRRLCKGDVLTAEQLESLTFVPVSQEEDAEAILRYLPITEEGLQPEAELVIAIRGKRDKAPQVEDTQVQTYKNLPTEGLLSASDPEGGALTYALTRGPKRGEVVLREDGSFLYTPRKNKVGTDSFAFTAADEAGNVSAEATVTIEVLKPNDEAQYADTAADHRFEAEWLRQTGIFSGETINGQFCFSPEEAVSRGQFLAMLMEVLELPTDRNAVETGFLDESPAWLRPYLAAAMASGIIRGYPAEGGMEFRASQPITQDEAARMISNALDFAIPTAALEGDSLPLALPAGDGQMTRAETAKTLYQISQLRQDSSIFGRLF